MSGQVPATLSSIPPCERRRDVPQEGVHDQGVAGHTDHSDDEHEEGDDVVGVVGDVHLAVEPAVHVHVLGEGSRRAASARDSRPPNHFCWPVRARDDIDWANTFQAYSPWHIDHFKVEGLTSEHNPSQCIHSASLASLNMIGLIRVKQLSQFFFKGILNGVIAYLAVFFAIMKNESL